ncbi:hypothetical protein H9L12_08305 [Sphingomonas rhizophila]|uniref:SIR2 family protein n=1 Tax=Sphingomonas rhizophila TaxID=2071607 RepID=A0A7G9S908_9SPHN|nr:hypothetical protein [Sphingomonas rhizophila]QNN64333.1 hypothetical protein H9L12_08305 [Sphingomonas rhizophila]
MFRNRTVLIVGAGASFEADFPIGGELLARLAKSLNITYQFNQVQTGDTRVENALRRHCIEAFGGDQHAGLALMNQYAAAGRRIAEAAREGMSIDAIIDQHENPDIELVGKVGIVREILKAEGSSKLKCPNGRYDELSLDSCKDTWLPRLGRLLVEGRKISELEQIFDNLTIITFNYDRSIEHYLPFSLVSHYGITLQRARELVSKLRIFHPFGTVGRLPWQQGEGTIVQFGDSDQADLIGVSSQIRTFTERLSDEATLSEMHSSISIADRIVMLGFAYHRPNLALLEPRFPTEAKQIFGTVKGISAQGQRAVKDEVAGMLKIGEQYVKLFDSTCSQLFDENWRSLTA